jgi:lipoate-protein ligase B
MHPREVTLVDLGRLTYTPALEVQRRLAAARREGLTGDWLLLVEHPPVFTLGRGHPDPDLRVPRDLVEREGIAIVQTERGGDITYHGPGQLVAYGVIDLRDWGIDVIDYVSGLERAVIAVLSRWGVAGRQAVGRRGVWVGDRKVASVGIHVRRWVTMHGIALNVDMELDQFSLINPCGLRDIEMTTLSREAGSPVRLGAVAAVFVEEFAREFSCTSRPGVLPDFATPSPAAPA